MGTTIHHKQFRNSELYFSVTSWGFWGPKVRDKYRRNPQRRKGLISRHQWMYLGTYIHHKQFRNSGIYFLVTFWGFRGPEVRDKYRRTLKRRKFDHAQIPNSLFKGFKSQMPY